MLMTAMRMLEWASLSEPLQRPPNGRRVLVDALDLMTNMRGIGWSWSKHTPVPPETRPTSGKSVFLCATLLRLLKCIAVYDVLDSLIRLIAPPGVATPAGGSIYDLSRPPLSRYAHSSLITFIYGGVFYFSMEIAYYAATLAALCTPGLRQQPSDWPTYSRDPWRATSIADFWGHRWHQTLRRSFTVLTRPLRKVLGRPGAVAGAFFLSGVLHDWCMWGMGKGTNFTQTGGFFMAMALGVVLEELWERFTGRRVDGLAGWLWTMGWLTAWGNLLVDAWMRTGLGGGEIFPQWFPRPGRVLLSFILHAPS